MAGDVAVVDEQRIVAGGIVNEGYLYFKIGCVAVGGSREVEICLGLRGGRNKE
jgi:hypothetical protein